LIDGYKRLLDYRITYRFWGIILLLALIELTTQAWAQTSTSEVRGAWLNLSAFDTAERRSTTLQTVTNANLNTIFVLAPPIGSNNGWSDPDDFSALVNEANDLGLSVHAWILNMWREVGHDADFADSSEQQLQKQWVLELLNSNPILDGVNFDFIRYRPPQPIDEMKINGVTNTIRITYDEVTDLHPRKFLTATSFRIEPFAADFDTEYIPLWFQNWIDNNPGNKYTTIEYPNGYYVPQHMKYQQNSEFWIKDRIVDAVMPMQYTTNDSIWNEEVDTWKSFLGDQIGKVFMGLGWYAGVGFDAPGIARKIKYGRSQGLKGFVIYTIGVEGVDDSDLVSILTVNQEANDFDAPFKSPASSFVPVQLSSFRIEVENGYVLLQWTTQSESENLGFRLYRSESKDSTFQQITENIIPGAGDSETTHHYYFIDQFVETGKTYYYKLASIKYDGNIRRYGPISVSITAPSGYVLEQNYPNPFSAGGGSTIGGNPATSISFSLKIDGHVSLKIYNLTGQLVRTLIDKRMKVGTYSVEWDGSSTGGNVMPSGTYVYAFEVNGHIVARKMAFVR